MPARRHRLGACIGRLAGVGAVTLAGSLVAASKLQGAVSGRLVLFPGARAVGGVLAQAPVAGGGLLVRGYGGGAAVTILTVTVLTVTVLTVAVLAFGVTPCGRSAAPTCRW